MKSFNCMWSHCCKDTSVCCFFCKKKCEWRCLDNHEKCPYKDTEEKKKEESFVVKNTAVRSHNELVDSKIRDKLRKYKKQNKLHNNSLANKMSVEISVVNRVLSNNSVVKIRSDSYRKIKEFVKTISNYEKRSLW